MQKRLFLLFSIAGDTICHPILSRYDSSKCLPFAILLWSPRTLLRGRAFEAEQSQDGDRKPSVQVDPQLYSWLLQKLPKKNRSREFEEFFKRLFSLVHFDSGLVRELTEKLSYLVETVSPETLESRITALENEYKDIVRACQSTRD